MTLSKHTHYIQIEDDRYAIFNNLIMDIFYVDKNELDSILSCSVISDVAETLLSSGIYVTKEQDDEKAESVLYDKLNNNLGHMDILYLILTNNCNLGCKYCFLDNNPNNEHHHASMTKEIAETAISKFYEHTIKYNIESPMILFYGGEPLICKELLRHCVEYSQRFNTNWRYSIISNGTLVDTEFVEFCKEHNVNVGISLDGPQWIHDTNRVYRESGKPTYDDCIKAVTLLNQAGVPYSISLVVSNTILDNSEELFNWIKENKIQNIFYNLMHFSLLSDDYKDYGERMPLFLTRSFDECAETGLSEGRIERQLESFGKQKFVFSDCGAVGCHQVTVLPNGQLTICHGDSVESSHCIGDVKSVDFNTIKNSPEGVFWLNHATLKSEKCMNCEALFICGGGCPHHAGNVFGDRNHNDENFCNYVKHVLRWLLKKA